MASEVPTLFSLRSGPHFANHPFVLASKAAASQDAEIPLGAFSTGGTAHFQKKILVVLHVLYLDHQGPDLTQFKPIKERPPTPVSVHRTNRLAFGQRADGLPHKWRRSPRRFQRKGRCPRPVYSSCQGGDR